LELIIEVWPKLSPAIRAGILAMINASEMAPEPVRNDGTTD
jgi:hypothetical protein